MNDRAAGAAVSPLALPAYRAFWVARLASSLGQMMLVVVIAWQVYDLARLSMPVEQAALLLGLLGLVQFLPVLGLSFLVGVLADRMDRRHIARSALALEVACALALFWLTLAGPGPLWPFFALALLLGVARAFASPSMAALAPNLVPVPLLPRAIAWSSIAWQAGAIGGPVAGGLAYDVAGPLAHALSALLFLVALVALLAIGPVPRPAPAAETPLAAVRSGLAWVRRQPVVLGAISLDLFAVVLGGATALLPVYARDILAVGPSGLGWLRGAPAIGAAVVALALTRLSLGRRVGAKMFAAVALFALATLVFGLSRHYPLSLVALGVLGAADMVSVYVRSTLIQLHTPDAVRGRVSALSMLFVSASNELGEFRAGAMAAVAGPVAAVAVGGALALFVTLAWIRLFPALWRADRLDRAPVSA